MIDNVGIWIALNRHYAGESSFRVTEATTLRSGIQLAAVDLPQVIVCCSESAEKSPAELSKMFGEAGVDEKRVICVAEPNVIRQAPDHLQMQVCESDRFIELVDRATRSKPAEPDHLHVDLLAHFDRPGAQDCEDARGFLNILEIDGSQLLLESTVRMDACEVVELNFFLPRFEYRDSQHERCQVSLRGEIKCCMDEEKLHYRFVSRSVEKQSKEFLEKFVASKRQKRENSK